MNLDDALMMPHKQIMAVIEFLMNKNRRENKNKREKIERKEGEERE